MKLRLVIPGGHQREVISAAAAAAACLAMRKIAW